MARKPKLGPSVGEVMRDAATDIRREYWRVFFGRTTPETTINRTVVIEAELSGRADSSDPLGRYLSPEGKADGQDRDLTQGAACFRAYFGIDDSRTDADIAPEPDPHIER